MTSKLYFVRVTLTNFFSVKYIEAIRSGMQDVKFCCANRGFSEEEKESDNENVDFGDVNDFDEEVDVDENVDVDDISFSNSNESSESTGGVIFIKDDSSCENCKIVDNVNDVEQDSSEEKNNSFNSSNSSNSSNSPNSSKSSEDKNAEMQRTVVVSNLPIDLTDEEFYNLFVAKGVYPV